jgi:hypoxanthine phosphoribosyltransferase
MTPLISEEEIREKVVALAKELNRHYAGKQVTIVTILKGAVCFLADLMRELSFPFELEFVTCSSYGMRGTKPGELTLRGFDTLLLEGKTVLLLDDIYDSGKTLSTAATALKEQGAASVETVVLLRKKRQKSVGIEPDFVCFDIEDHFVVGYGLDYKESGRGLKGIFTREG